MFSRLLSLTRYMIIIPVIGAWLSALLAMIFGAYEVVQTFLLIPNSLSDKTLKVLVLNLIEAVDLFLLGTAFYLIALGLYKLFVHENAPVPAWLEIRDLDDLKNRLLGVVVVVLSVQFLAFVLGWTGNWNILSIGAAIAVVILALALFIGQKGKKGGKVTHEG